MRELETFYFTKVRGTECTVQLRMRRRQKVGAWRGLRTLRGETKKQEIIIGPVNKKEQLILAHS